MKAEGELFRLVRSHTPLRPPVLKPLIPPRKLKNVPFDQKERAQQAQPLLFLGKDVNFNLSSGNTEHPFLGSVKCPIDMSHLSSTSGAYLRDDDLTIWPKFLDFREQRLLAEQSMAAMERVLGIPAHIRKKRKMWIAEKRIKTSKEVASGSGRAIWKGTSEPTIDDMFMPEDCYEFEEGHFDSVIQNYRESSIREFDSSTPELPRILRRLISLTTTGKKHRPVLQMHVLHLASNGCILPHIDSIMNSGDEILGVSLGAPRVMRLSIPPPRDGEEPSEDYIDVLLESGSVYLQKGVIRRTMNHEILLKGEFDGQVYEGGERLSFLLRDIPQDDEDPANVSARYAERQSEEERHEYVSSEYSTGFNPFDYNMIEMVKRGPFAKSDLKTKDSPWRLERSYSVPPRG